MVKTKRLLREKVWFPGIEDKVKKTVEDCIACKANSPFSLPVPSDNYQAIAHSEC